MKYALDSESMKRVDGYTTDVIGIPAMVLMERAALEIASVMKKVIKKTDRILAVCGPGNNGGDGIAAGRILFLQGYQVAILLCGDTIKFSGQMAQQLEIAKNLGMKFENNNKLGEYNIIIDALFGVGLSRAVTGAYEEVITAVNNSNNTVFAVDIPSGISADTGSILNAAVRADYTITFGYEKQGLLVYPGAEYAGEVTVADIGFPDTALSQVNPDTFYYTEEDLNLLPKRSAYSHKGTYGKVLVIAGSKGMSGAAYLSAKAAYKTGAGLVKILTAGDNRTILQTLLPEALFASYDKEGMNQEELQKELLLNLKWASAVVIGPGIGQSELSEKLLDIVVKNCSVPLIIDADALNLLAGKLDHESMDTKVRLELLKELLHKDTVLTPHLMELSRLMKLQAKDIADNIIDTAGQCSYNNELVYAIKDARTIVAKAGRKYINVSGNNGMATGGSGDVLTGIIAALIAQGLKPFDAACLAVYIHGLAGDKAAGQLGTYSLIAGDIADSIDKVLITCKHRALP